MPPADASPWLDELPPGSARYYVVRLAHPERRAQTAAAARFALEMDHTVARCQDPGATRLKLDWWRKELASAAASAHPLAQALAPLAQASEGLTALHALIDAAESDVRQVQPRTTADFHAQCEQAGALADLLCLAAGTPCEVPALGRYAAGVSRVRTLGRYLQRGHNPLPAALDLPAQPQQWQPGDLATACDQLLSPLHDAAAPVLHDRAGMTLPARRWASIARARHRLLAREGYPVRDQLIDITPIARLWHAWRVR